MRLGHGKKKGIYFSCDELERIGRFIHLIGTITHSRESASIRQPSAATCYFN